MDELSTDIVPPHPGRRVFQANLLLLEAQERGRDPDSRLATLLTEARHAHQQIWRDYEVQGPARRA